MASQRCRVTMQGPGFAEAPGGVPTSEPPLPRASSSSSESSDSEEEEPHPLEGFSEESLIMAAEYMASRGEDGLPDLRDMAASPLLRRLLSRVKLHGAAMNDQTSSISFLVDRCGASVFETDEAGSTALHHAAVWDRMHSMFALLARGGDALLSFENSEGRRASQWVLHNERIVNNVELLLKDMEELGGFSRWCLLHAENPYVKRYVRWVGRELRLQMLVLREQINQRRELQAKLNNPRVPRQSAKDAPKEKKPWDTLTEPVSRMRRRPRRRRDAKPRRRLKPRKPLPAAVVLKAIAAVLDAQKVPDFAFALILQFLY